MTGPTAAVAIWGVIPVKNLAIAKSRLAPILGPAQRAALAAAMLGDVLEAVVRSEAFAGILVVTDDEDAVSLAREFGAGVLGDRIDGGINAAVLRGIREVEALGAAGAAIVPGDIPLVTASELQTVRQALCAAPVVIVPATRDGGTNILAMAPPGRMQPSFGTDSFDRHRAAAAAAGLRPALLSLEGAGRDIDVPADLVFCRRAKGAAVRTRACLRRFAPAMPSVPSGPTEEVLLS